MHRKEYADKNVGKPQECKGVLKLIDNNIDIFKFYDVYGIWWLFLISVIPFLILNKNLNW